MRFVLGWAFDTWINLRYCIAEAGKQLGYMVDDALDIFEDEMTCSCGATAPVGTEGWRSTDADWCPKCAWLA